MTRDEVIKRLEALLRMRTDRGATQAEMETAMELAAKLALKYRINLNEIVPDKEGHTHYGDEMIGRDYRTFAPPYSGCIHDLLNKYFGVRTVRLEENAATIKIIGLPLDVDFAMYVYAYLRVCFKKLWLIYQDEEGCTSKLAKSFWQGLWKGLDEKLAYSTTQDKRAENMSSNGKALMLLADHDKALKLKVDELCPETTMSRKSSMRVVTSAYEAGREAAKEVQINKALSGGNAKL